MTAGFQFDVPVRFAASVDAFAELQANAYQTWAMASVECIEVLDEIEWPEMWYPGGCYDHGAVASDIALSAADGQLHRINQTASVNAYLPAPDPIPPGAVIFVVSVAATATGTVQLRDDSGATVGSAIAAGSTKTVGLSSNGTTATWILY